MKNFGKNAGWPYTAKDILLETQEKEISNHKAFDKVIEYFPRLRQDIFKGDISIARSLKRLIKIINRLAQKSKRKGSITTKQILNLLVKTSDYTIKLAI